MCPDCRRTWMTAQYRFHWVQVCRWFSGIGKRSIDIVVNQNDETGLFCQIENSIQGRIEQAGDTARNFGRHELFMNRELANSAEHAGESSQNAPDMICSVHVRRIEACDHRVEACLLLR